MPLLTTLLVGSLLAAPLDQQKKRSQYTRFPFRFVAGRVRPFEGLPFVL